MSDISTFVNSVFDCFDELVCDAEEEQQLPPMDVLEEVSQVLLNVSTMREEGRFPSFRVCFIEPESDFLDSYIYAHVLLFKNSIEFNVSELHKLAPALNAGMSYLMLNIRERPFRIIGVIASYTMWEKIITGEISSGNRMPRIPNLFVSGPGELKACFGEASVVSYNSGSCVFYRTNTFTSTLVAEQLANGSNIPEKERLQLLYRIIWQMIAYEQGGAIMIVPSAESCKEFIDLKYQMSSSYLFNSSSLISKYPGKARGKDLATYADLIAKLTAVDGSVVLTKDLDLLGFGAETLVDQMESKQPDMCFIGYDDHEDTTKQFRDNGMRHRAGYRFCNAVTDSVAFIMSKDGMIEACTKQNGRVIVYTNVALPFL